ncbi:MAG: hypothetical protein M1823_001009 [Watsoniomyces obsoletus]|nr:MAG: hypothetical protein M1823_001009 [Watsoniomyces obsoletus]
MAAPVTRLPLVKLPPGPASETPEQRYWRSFRSQLQIPSPSSHPVTHISHPGSATCDLFAVVAGLRVQLYSLRTRKLTKTIARFDDVVRSADLRRDGRMMVAGDDTGTIQAFDISSRAILKSWKEHKQPVWATGFSPRDVTTLMSASDDRTVRMWSLASQESTATFVGHSDYVRAGAFIPGTNANTLVSGSYDGTVRIWDPRATGRAAMIFKHRAPVEDVLPMPSGTTLLASAYNQVSVLDLVAGKPLQMLRAHQKTVTSLSLASKGTRLLAAGLDGHVKVFETTAWNVVAGSKYPSPILSMCAIAAGPTQDDRHLAVGMQSGVLSIRTRSSKQEYKREAERAQEMAALIEGKLEEHDRKQGKKRKRTRGWEKRLRGRDFRGEGADVIIEGRERRPGKKLAQWEVDLRKGRYGVALDQVLDKKHTRTVLTLLTALRHRSAMRAALQGRDEITLQPILQWITKYLPNPRYVAVAVEVGVLVIDIYSVHLGQSPEIDRLVRTLHLRVRKEVERAQQACQTRGMLDLLLADAAPATEM